MVGIVLHPVLKSIAKEVLRIAIIELARWLMKEDDESETG